MLQLFVTVHINGNKTHSFHQRASLPVFLPVLNWYDSKLGWDHD